MSVYVDDMYKYPTGQFRGMKMSHLMADTTEELLDMVKKIGVRKKWIQKPNTPYEHFDICMSKRELAVKNGAQEVTWRWIGEYTLDRVKKFKQNNDTN